MAWQRFRITFYTTTDGKSAGEGMLWLAELSPDPAGPYGGEIALKLDGYEPVSSLELVATSRRAGELTVVAAEDSAATLRLALLRNPFEEQLSFGGSACYEETAYNVVAVTAP